MVPNALDILVVDDEPDYCSTLADILQMSGYSVRTATTVEKARTEAREQPPRLVLLDWLLAGNGRGLLSEFRAARVPVIVVTGARAPNLSGAAAVVVKPFEVEQLLAIVRDHLA